MRRPPGGSNGSTGLKVLAGVLPAVALVSAAVAALVGAAGACGSQISVPDQGVIITGCQPPGYCFATTCECSRASVQTGGSCVVAPVCGTDPANPSACNCPLGDMGTDSRCVEVAQECVGRGPLCAQGSTCVPLGTSCGAGGMPPMVVPGPGATLESRCQFTDDVCCPAGSDGGVANTD